ncbi:hypothetical protein LTR56_009876 [Elasticomyces elasticus]|nr:hypothetical protein LTR56_009876 [Elasticomyces elasticus]KAK3659192.1 hypothetical protein LTR22_008655 [Elasticomyces elasticus]
MPPTHTTMEASVKYLKEMSSAVRGLAQKSKQGVPDREESSSIAAWYTKIEDQLSWLENDARMTVELKNMSQIDKVLPLMFADERFHFTRELSERSRVLFERFESERWGAPNEDTEMVDEVPRRASASPPRRERRDDARALRCPPAGHRIWGINGMMHGLALTVPNSRGPGRPAYNPRFKCRNSKIHGHNEIAVGAWYPRQLAACFHGAHGSSQGGIAGSGESSAYSIVSSGAYSDVDIDQGNFLYYSAAESQTNKNPREPATSAALSTSLRTRKPAERTIVSGLSALMAKVTLTSCARPAWRSDLSRWSGRAFEMKAQMTSKALSRTGESMEKTTNYE